jgi:pimeloyl-ACP methyl ester carboxylesterase
MKYTRSILIMGDGLRVEHYKPQRPKRLPPLLFVHGIFHGSWLWWNFMDFFASRGITCYGLNFRGHFMSSGHDRLGQAEVEDYVTDVITCLNAIDTETILIGHSMGGIVSQKVAESTRIQKLILLDSAPCRHITENYLELDPERFEITRSAFLPLPDDTSIMERNPDTVRKLLFEKNKVSDEALMQTFALLGRESTRVMQKHGFLPVDPDKIACPVFVLGRTGLGNSKNPNLWDAIADYLHAAERSIRSDISHNMMCELDWMEHAQLVETWCFE